MSKPIQRWQLCFTPVLALHWDGWTTLDGASFVNFSSQLRQTLARNSRAAAEVGHSLDATPGCLINIFRTINFCVIATDPCALRLAVFPLAKRSCSYAVIRLIFLLTGLSIRRNHLSPFSLLMFPAGHPHEPAVPPGDDAPPAPINPDVVPPKAWSRRQAPEPGLLNFPMLEDIYDVVPLPLIHYVPPPPDTEYSPDSLRLVRDVTRQPPVFDSHPFCFTLPVSPNAREDFIAAMKGTVLWISNGKPRANGKLRLTAAEADALYKKAPEARSGAKRVHQTTQTFKCPCARIYQQVERPSKSGNTRKVEPLRKCDCRAQYLIRDRIDNQHLEVTWFWQHNDHNPYDLELMRKMCIPKQARKLCRLSSSFTLLTDVLPGERMGC